MNISVDAVNYCHTDSLYQAQVNAAQDRCNYNRTTELVVRVDANGNVTAQRVITPNRELPELVRNLWK